jgi:hypothetical protein
MSPDEFATYQALRREAEAARNAAGIQRSLAQQNAAAATSTFANLKNFSTQFSFTEKREDANAIIARLDAELASLRRNIEATKQQAKDSYNTAELLYKGVVTPMGAVSALTPKCSAIIQPELAAAGFAFALASTARSEIDQYDGRDVNAISENLARGSQSELQTAIDAAEKQNKYMHAVLKKEQDAEADLQKYASKMINDYGKCRNLQPPETEYDPLSLITHAVNFIITANGSVTPSWKLARVTTPSSTTFASIGRKTTNTLTIGLGRSGEAVATQIQTQQLRSVLSNP